MPDGGLESTPKNDQNQHPELSQKAAEHLSQHANQIDSKISSSQNSYEADLGELPSNTDRRGSSSGAGDLPRRPDEGISSSTGHFDANSPETLLSAKSTQPQNFNAPGHAENLGSLNGRNSGLTDNISTKVPGTAQVSNQIPSANQSSPGGDLKSSNSNPQQARYSSAETSSAPAASAPQLERQALNPSASAQPTDRLAPSASSHSDRPISATAAQSPSPSQPLDQPSSPAGAPGSPERSSSAFHADQSRPPNPSPASRGPLEQTGGDRIRASQGETAGTQARGSWYSARSASLQGGSDQVQKTPAGANAAVADRPVSPLNQNQAPPQGKIPDRLSDIVPGKGLAANEKVFEPVDKVSDKAGSGRSNLEGLSGQLADGKGGVSKPNSWIDGPDPTTRKAEVGPGSGQIAYGGVTPDGREHPFGLAGRMMDSKTEPDRSHGGGDSGPSVIGQILDGHGGWKPNLKLPFADKEEKDAKDVRQIKEGKDTRGGGKIDADDVKSAGRKIKDISMLESTIMEERGPRANVIKDSSDKAPGRRALINAELEATMIEDRSPASKPGDAKAGVRRAFDGGILEATLHDDQVSTRKTPSTADGKTPAEALIGIIESVKTGIVSGARLPFGVPFTSKDNATALAESVGKSELTVTGVRTKAWPVNTEGTPVAAVALLPFVSGGTAGLRVVKDIADGADAAVAINISIAVAASVATVGAKTSAVREIGGDTVEVPHLLLQTDGEPLPQFFEEGRLKSRPAVNLHLPGGKYGGDKAEIDKDSDPGKNLTANKPKPYLSMSSEGLMFDLSQTSADLTVEPLLGPGIELPQSESLATAEASGEQQRPAKAIDELEATAQMSPSEAKELRQGNRDDRYLYTVEPGDTIESVSAIILGAPGLAPLLFSLNRKYVLPEVLYGVHPLMEGVVIKLPTPADIIKFGPH